MTAPLTLIQEDWTRFLTADGLSEKAGVHSSNFAVMLIEPHTRRTVGLGTIAVAAYLEPGREVAYNVSSSGLLSVDPEHRFAGLLFVEKEGFYQLITDSGVLERYDLALASTKGMSNIAVRSLINDMARRRGDFTVYTLTDFDITGISIADTLVGDTRRFQYAHSIQYVPLAVDWGQAQTLHDAGLSEPSGRDSATSYADGLRDKGLSDAAVEFLTEQDGTGLRVELNALKPKALLDIIEQTLAEKAPTKVVPPATCMNDPGYELRIRKALSDREAALRAEPKAAAPEGLFAAVHQRIKSNPSLSWDEAIAAITEAGEDV
jgi:hypothetical protein